MDCSGSVFIAGPNHTVNNFERHLNRRQHRANVTKHLAQAEESGPSNVFAPACLPTTSDFEYQPPQSLAVFAQQQSSRSLETLRSNITQYFVTLENDAASKAVRKSVLEERIAASEKKHGEEFNSMYEQLSMFRIGG